MPHHLRPSILKALLRPCHREGLGPTSLCLEMSILSRQKWQPRVQWERPRVPPAGAVGAEMRLHTCSGCSRGLRARRAHLRMQVIAHFHLGQGTDASIF